MPNIRNIPFNKMLKRELQLAAHERGVKGAKSINNTWKFLFYWRSYPQAINNTCWIEPCAYLLDKSEFLKCKIRKNPIDFFRIFVVLF